MIADEALPIKCVSLNAVGGYDTHSDEAGTLATNLGETIESVLAFQRDLEARGIDDRVVIQLWSEFGRRPGENGSGTDHGAAGVSFLIGSRVKGRWWANSRGSRNSTRTKTWSTPLTSARCTRA